jgi:hypothetical protein
MNDYLGKYISKKFTLSLLTVASAHWLVQADHIADGVYSAVVIATVVAFVIGDALERKAA